MKMNINPELINGGKYLPNKGHANDAGIDCYAQQDTLLPVGKAILVPLGFRISLPEHTRAFLTGRSSFNKKGILTLLGTIDEGYHGELCAGFVNLSGAEYQIKEGDRICQLVIDANPDIMDVGIISDIPREEGGFGSTGK